MTISNELASEIAAALIDASDKEPIHLKELKAILLEVQSTLQKMTEETKRIRNAAHTTDEGDPDRR